MRTTAGSAPPSPPSRPRSAIRPAGTSSSTSGRCPGVTASEVATTFSLHPNVARHHLQRLVDGGYVRVETGRNAAGAGRPSKRYFCVEEELQLGLMQRRDDLLMRLLAEAMHRLGPEEAEEMAAHVGEEYGRSLASRMTPNEGQRTVRAAMHVVAETLTAHGFAAHAEDRGETTAVVAEQCPFGDASSTNPVLCAVDRGMVKGLLSGPVRDGVTAGPPGDPLLAGAGRRRLHRLCLRRPWRAPISTTPARLRRGPRRSPPSRTGPRCRRPIPGRVHEEGRDRPRRARGGPRPGGRVSSAWPDARSSSPRVRPSRSTPPSGARREADPGAPVLCAAVEHSAVRDASARLAPTEDVGGGRRGTDRRRRATGPAALGRPTAPGAGALPVGEPRGRHAPAGPRGGRAVPRGRGHGPRGRRRRLRSRADGPRRAGRRPRQHQRAQARWRARCRAR